MQKKILIMIMSCNIDSFFLQEEEIVKQTWLKDIIDKKYDNIDYVIYRGDENLEKHNYNKENHLLNIKVEDDYDHTFKKTYYAFKLCDKIFKDYDYIFKTNTSTYINIELLNEFIQTIQDDSILYGGEIYSLSNLSCPYPLDLYARGNAMIISKKIKDIILQEGLPFLYNIIPNIPDDSIIATLLNSYWIKNNEQYLNHICGFSHAWYDCVPNEKLEFNHQLCRFGNKNIDWNFLNKFISIQVKKYHQDRMPEFESLKTIDKVFKSNKFTKKTLKESIDKNNEYMKNYSIFIGSLLGYINLDKWIDYNKMELYTRQIYHKASDDVSYKQYKKWI